MGFVFPWERWLRKPLKEWAAGVLFDRGSLEATGFNEVAVRRLWGEFQRPGSRARYSEILCLIHLMFWVKRHGLGPGDSRRG